MSLFNLLAATRWIHFAAAFVLFGVPLFWIISGEDTQQDHVPSLPQSLRASLHLLRLAVPVALITGVAWIAEILANITDGIANLLDPQTLRLFFFATQFGPVALLRLALLLALVITGILPLRHRQWFFSLLATSAALLVSQAWFGHAAEGGVSLAGAGMILAYGLHLLAGAAWIGGLPALFLALAELRRIGKAEAAGRALRLLSRYSAMAMGSVCVILLSGFANTSFRVGLGFDRLFGTPYGAVLFVKLLLVAGMLALAYVNRCIAMPRLRREDGVPALAGLRISVGIELLLGILVLGAAAVLGITPPPQ